MLKVLSYILCDLDPKVKVIGQKAGICDGVPSTSALVYLLKVNSFKTNYFHFKAGTRLEQTFSLIFFRNLIAKERFDSIHLNG